MNESDPRSNVLALHRYRRGHGFKSRTGLNFLRPYFHYCLSSAHYCEDHSHSRTQSSISQKLEKTYETMSQYWRKVL